MLLVIFSTGFVLAATYIFYHAFIATRFDVLRNLPGPPTKGLLPNRSLTVVLEPATSPKAHEIYVKQYGRTIRLQGLGPWDQRLFSLDPLSMAHVLKNPHIYEKPSQSRTIITALIGCGMLAAEGAVHKRQRRVATPAFSVQNLRALVPLVFNKGLELKERWFSLIESSGTPDITMDVTHWINRATFDVIGLAGFDYEFNAIRDETNELFSAYKTMFEVGISQEQASIRQLLGIYFPIINLLFPTEALKTVKKCQEVIRRVAGQLIQEKKRKIAEGEANDESYKAKDLLTLLIKSNMSIDIAPEHRISDEDMLHNINTFLFAGSDTSSLAVAWTLLLLAQHPAIQDRLRNELATIQTTESLIDISAEEIDVLYNQIAELPYLHNVVRESLRLIPPIHSSLRVATQDDEIPISYPVKQRLPDGTICEDLKHVKISKGSFVHVPIEGFNLDKEIWGQDAWIFNPDRWDNLPEAVNSQPGLFSNLLTFSAGPRSCIGMRFSMIEIKTFSYLLVSNFSFHTTEAKIFKANVVLTRPYVVGKFKEGSQCPLRVVPLGRK